VRNGNQWLAIKLQGNGTTTNRDAIGARVVVTLQGNRPRTMVRTLRAGDGFLSQSSKWLHFGLGQGGLGNDQKVEQVVVNWPGGGKETFRNLASQGHYILAQGSSSARLWKPPQATLQWEHSPSEIAKSSQRARVFMASRVPIPQFTYDDFKRGKVTVGVSDGRPKLINLWASWCAPCLKEMQEWTDQEATLSEFPLDVVALSTDGLGENPQTDRDDATNVISRIGFPFHAGMANDEILAMLQAVMRAMIDKPTPLAVPTSILLDGNGRIAAVYVGPVELDRLLADARLLDASDAEIQRHAAHLPGRWVQGPDTPGPTPIVRKLIAAGLLKVAKRYLAQTLSDDPRQARTNSEALYSIATRLRSEGNHEEALATYRQALRLNPTQPRINTDMGVVLMAMRRFDEAIEPLQTAFEQNLADVDARKRLVIALCLGGEGAQALPHAQYLVGANKNDAFARLFLAKALLASRKTDEAVQQYRAAFVLALPKTARFGQAIGRVRKLVETDPSDPFARLFFAKALQTRNRAQDAIVEYRNALKLRSGWVTAQNDLAWLLATHPDEKVRDGPEALRLAQSACKTTDFKVPAILDTLAAAQAETGEFATATATIDKAIALAGKAGAEALLKQLESRRRQYSTRQPFRENPQIAP
jgi:tetratricopeptide (TPR) repeat protein